MKAPTKAFSSLKAPTSDAKIICSKTYIGADSETLLVLVRVLVILVPADENIGEAGLARAGGAEDHEARTRVPEHRGRRGI